MEARTRDQGTHGVPRIFCARVSSRGVSTVPRTGKKYALKQAFGTKPEGNKSKVRVRVDRVAGVAVLLATTVDERSNN